MTESAARFDASLALLDEVPREARAREAAFAAWLDEAGPKVAAELTEELIPADLRAAGMRFEWTEAQPVLEWPECMCTPSGECGNCWEKRQKRTEGTT